MWIPLDKTWSLCLSPAWPQGSSVLDVLTGAASAAVSKEQGCLPPSFLMETDTNALPRCVFYSPGEQASPLGASSAEQLISQRKTQKCLLSIDLEWADCWIPQNSSHNTQPSADAITLTPAPNNENRKGLILLCKAFLFFTTRRSPAQCKIMLFHMCNPQTFAKGRGFRWSSGILAKRKQTQENERSEDFNLTFFLVEVTCIQMLPVPFLWILG